VLKILIDTYGRKEIDEDISAIKQHQDIFNKIEEMVGMASVSFNELTSKKKELDKILMQHFNAEEKHLFPKALHAYGGLQEFT
jgi:hemerythrin superfamily protein